MLTSDDIKLLIETFKPRQEADADLRMMEERLSKKLDKIMDGVDGMAGELKTVRIEQIANQSAHDRFEERLEEIEKVPVIAHSIKLKK